MGGQYRDLDKKRAKNRKYARSEKGRAMRRRTWKTVQRRLAERAQTEPRPLRRIPCPHCGEALFLPGNSAFVIRKEEVGETFAADEYQPNPARTYKQPEAIRRRSLAYYWRNRDRVLAREKARRERIKALLAG